MTVSTAQATAVPGTVGQVVGANLKRIREELDQTQRQFAVTLRMGGVPWKRFHLANIESGRRRDVQVKELALLAVALQVPARQLLSAAGGVELAKDTVVSDLWAVLEDPSETELPNAAMLNEASFGALFEGEHGVWDADERLAARLGVALDDVVDTAERLWGRTLTEERNARASTLPETTELDVRRARRGVITRELAAELEKQLPTKAKGRK
jgi:transcriptional regulator with XRE-family HTH domain